MSRYFARTPAGLRSATSLLKQDDDMPPRRCMGNRTSWKLVMPSGRQRLANIRTWLRRTSCALCDQTSLLDGSENEVYLQILPPLLIISLVALPRIPIRVTVNRTQPVLAWSGSMTPRFKGKPNFDFSQLCPLCGYKRLGVQKTRNDRKSHKLSG
jgi:hypothetical protein